MKKLSKAFRFIISSAFVFASFVGLTSVARAQSFLPEPIENIFELLGPGGGGTSEFVQSRVSALLLIFLGVIILAAVLYTAFAALKYIRSQGDEGEVETARKGIEAIFQGIAVMLIAIVGIVLIFVFFGAELFAPSLYQTCVSAANSVGCNSCTDSNGGLPADWDDIKFDQDLTSPTGVQSLSSGESISNETRTCMQCEWLYFASSRSNQSPDVFMQNVNINVAGDSLSAISVCTE